MTEAKPTKLEPVIGKVAAVAPSPIAQVQGSIRANFARYHLQAAASFARQTYDIESGNQDSPFNDTSNPIYWHASSSVIMSVAALEARINEIIKEIIDSNSKSTDLWQQASKLMKRKITKPQGPSELSFKYKKIACLYEKTENQSSNTYKDLEASYEDLEALISFRHELVHFKPEWDHEKDRHKKAFDMLDGKFSPTPNIVFPMSHLNYSGAKWAVDTARTFSENYAKIIKSEDHFADIWINSKLPCCPKSATKKNL